MHMFVATKRCGINMQVARHELAMLTSLFAGVVCVRFTKDAAEGVSLVGRAFLMAVQQAGLCSP